MKTTTDEGRRLLAENHKLKRDLADLRAKFDASHEALLRSVGQGGTSETLLGRVLNGMIGQGGVKAEAEDARRALLNLCRVLQQASVRHHADAVWGDGVADKAARKAREALAGLIVAIHDEKTEAA